MLGPDLELKRIGEGLCAPSASSISCFCYQAESAQNTRKICRPSADMLCCRPSGANLDLNPNL